MPKQRVVPGAQCADKSNCEQSQVGKSKYCRTHRAESRARFKQNVSKWHAQAEVRKHERKVERIHALEVELAALKA